MDYERGASNAIAIIPDAWADPDDGARGSAAAGVSSRAIGRMFFKTKLCCKFRAGACPFTTTCNFAHGLQELRRPPPNWEDIICAQPAASDPPPPPPPPPPHHIIPPSSGGAGYNGRAFLHDEHSRARESVAISLSPAAGGGGSQKPLNWRTRICNKWEMAGYCPFGTKCHFAHGPAELHHYGGGLVETGGQDTALVSDSKQAGVLPMAQTDTAVRSSISVPHVHIFNMGTPLQRLSGINPRQGERPLRIWKGPDTISRIYGDWLDNLK